MTRGISDGTTDPTETVPAQALPPALQAGLARHRSHLAELSAVLRRAGMADAQIKASLEGLTASYRAELARTLNFMDENRT